MILRGRLCVLLNPQNRTNTSTEPMKPIGHRILQSLVACTVVCSLTSQLHAWEPNAKDLDSAVSSGEFSGYFGNLTGWLSQKAPTDPSKITQTAMETLLKDPIVSVALAQRQFIGKVGPDKLAAFAKMDADSKPFLSWLLKNPKALDLYLPAATPLSIPVREDNSYQLSTDVLDRWKKIFAADPESKDGTALRPPGTGSPGSGQQKVHSPPYQRYTYFKKAHANNELFPSFNNLTVWELQFVVCSGASEADLTWGREMVNTWRPDYRIGEKVVDTTSCVWRRNSPVSHVDYRTVLDGGGKCGPRSSWSVFICQAFGIPAIGVGQPAHACVAYHDCFTGGKQVHFQAHMQSAEVTYEIEVPEAGVYGMELKLAAANTDQVISARVIDAAAPAEKSVIPVPYTTGLWQTVKGPDLKLNKGKQTIEVSHGFQRGVAFKSFDLKLKDKS